MSETILGYTIERTGKEHTPYLLHGKRGACYGLVRNQNHPELLFPVNTKGFCKNAIVKGNTWFREKDGKLVGAW